MKLPRGSKRSAGRPRGAVLVLAVALFSTSCQGSGRPDAAVWRVQPGQQIGPDSTTFTALVRRLGCNNGLTGDSGEYGVRVDDDAVTVTFYVEPNPSDVSCPGNDEVAWEVELPEPLGPRELVDGQCSRGGEASASTFCRPDGVRYPAADGAPAVD